MRSDFGGMFRFRFAHTPTAPASLYHRSQCLHSSMAAADTPDKFTCLIVDSNQVIQRLVGAMCAALPPPAAMHVAIYIPYMSDDVCGRLIAAVAGARVADCGQDPAHPGGGRTGATAVPQSRKVSVCSKLWWHAPSTGSTWCSLMRTARGARLSPTQRRPPRRSGIYSMEILN